MTKVISTIGPESEGSKTEFFVNNSDVIRLNLSHNDIFWHEKNIKLIKKINSKRLILVDLPGIKPRTSNEINLQIKKGQKVQFSNNKKFKNKNLIYISNPLPKIKKNKFFYISDGSFQFKNLGIDKNILTGVSMQNFILTKKKGLNIPMSVYDNKGQEKLYFKFLKKIKKFQVDLIGLSFVQNSKILKKIKIKYPDYILVSKIENYLGYKNRKDIIESSDAIMIDRGDLSAEVGITKLFDYTDNIIDECKKKGKPVILATENLNSLILNKQPSKGDVTNIEYYVKKKVDFLMLSEETAISKNSKNTLTWLKQYLKSKDTKKKESILKIEEIVNSLGNNILVIFSKKGYFYEKISSSNYNKLLVFTENKKLSKILQLKRNTESILTKFPKKNLDIFLYREIKKNKNKIFKNNSFAYLVNILFPRQNSRANTISLIEKRDF
jgi:pyruvate kinase